MNHLAWTLVASILTAHPGRAQAAPAAWLDAARPVEARTDLLLKEMTLEEKGGLCVGTRAFFVRSLARLGIPEVTAGDGPTGVAFMRPASIYPNRSPSTSFPGDGKLLQAVKEGKVPEARIAPSVSPGARRS